MRSVPICLVCYRLVLPLYILCYGLLVKSRYIFIIFKGSMCRTIPGRDPLGSGFAYGFSFIIFSFGAGSPAMGHHHRRVLAPIAFSLTSQSTLTLCAASSGLRPRSIQRSPAIRSVSEPEWIPVLMISTDPGWCCSAASKSLSPLRDDSPSRPPVFSPMKSLKQGFFFL